MASRAGKGERGRDDGGREAGRQVSEGRDREEEDGKKGISAWAAEMDSDS